MVEKLIAHCTVVHRNYRTGTSGFLVGLDYLLPMRNR